MSLHSELDAPVASNLPLDFCPYKGLAPYTEKDRAYFFGRERDQEIIISNLYASHLTVLYGASGVGKSSVLLAGVVPQLRKEPRLAVVVFSKWLGDSFVQSLKQEVINAVRLSRGKETLDTAPNEIDESLPLDELLAVAATVVHGPIFLIFDQFEEYFLYHPVSEDVDAFEAEFARAVNRRDVNVNFLLSLREDGLSKLDRFQGRISTLLSNMLRLEHLDRASAKEAITKPLDEYNHGVSSQNSITIEPELIERVTNEVSSMTAGSSRTRSLEVSGDGYQTAGSDVKIETPLLQMVLTRLWDEEKLIDSKTLRVETFVKLGGAEKIASTHLDKIMDKLTEQERSVAASVLHYLVTPSGSKIAQEAEALVSWAKLKEADVEAILRRLCASDTRILRTVQAPEQPVRYEILHDVMAQAILDWRMRYVLEEEKLDARRKLLRRRKKVATWSLLITAVVLILTFVLVKLSRSKHVARSQALAAFSASQLDEDPQLSLLLAIEAVKESQNQRSIEALRAALLEDRLKAIIQTGKTNRIAAVSFSPDGKYVVTGTWDHTVRVWTVPEGEPFVTLLGPTGQINSASFSNDGKYIIAADSDKETYVWENWQTGSPQLIKTLTEPQALMTATFSPDGEHIVTGGAEGKVRVWEWKKAPNATAPKAELDLAAVINPVATPTPSQGAPAALLAHARRGQTPNVEPTPSPVSRPRAILVYKALFNPANGDYIAIAGNDRRAAFIWNWKAELGKNNPIRLIGHRFSPYDICFSNDGQYVATGSDDGSARVWDTNKPQKPLAILDLKDIRVRSVAFSPDGNFVGVASYDKLARLWEWRKGTPKASEQTSMVVFPGHTGLLVSIAYSPDGQLVVTGSVDGTARLWRATRLDTTLDHFSADELLELAKTRVTRSLTPEESIKYLNEPLRN